MGCSMAGMATMVAVVLKDLFKGSPVYGSPRHWLDFALTLAAVVMCVVPPLAAMVIDDHDDFGGGWE